MKRFLKVFIITFMLMFCLQAALDLPAVKRYLRKEIIAAKILCLKAKYNIKPRGLNLCTTHIHTY